MLLRMVSLKRTVSWVTRASCARRLRRVTSRMSRPSMVMRPPVGSQKRGSRLATVVLPPPEPPTSATTSPFRISSESRWSTGPSP